MSMFDSKELFFDHCIEKVTHSYIYKALGMIDADEEQYRLIFKNVRYEQLISNISSAIKRST
jgi:hypothetical protein